MNADSFRQLYDYHFAENRKIWELAAQLSPEQFQRHSDYSRGSVREQIVHLIDADQVWFCELQAVEPVNPLPAVHVDGRQIIRQHWDGVEKMMRRYLADLRDDMLFTRPIVEPEEDRELMVWQVLIHVVNHATDHRAQILRLLNDMGVETLYQDFIFHVYAAAAVSRPPSAVESEE